MGFVSFVVPPLMTPLALSLVVIAAFIHATWNYAAKRSGGGLPFVWLSSTFALGLYAVAGTGYWLWRQPILPDGIWWIVAVCVPSGFA